MTAMKMFWSVYFASLKEEFTIGNIIWGILSFALVWIIICMTHTGHSAIAMFALVFGYFMGRTDK